jgi:tRNA G18 (ribose-2'-O)-methylase SpoU
LTVFEMRECSRPECKLRFPLSPEQHRGVFCPRCGAPLKIVSAPFAHQSPDLIEDQPFRRLTVLLDNLRSAHNVGAIFRTADGAGVRQLYLCGITPTPDDNPAIGKTALGSEDHLSWSYHPNGLDLALELQGQGSHLIALESTPDARPFYQFFDDSQRSSEILLIVGNEKAGIDPGILELCNDVLFLPMAGEKESLNVAVAFGIAVYSLAFVQSGKPCFPAGEFGNRDD